MSAPLWRRRDCLAGLTGLAAAGLAPAQDEGPSLRPWPKDRPTPPLALAGYDGPGWTLAQAKGRPVLLNFWASWCEPCRSEMPSLELVAQRYESRGLIVMAVNYRESDGAMKRFLDQMPVSLPILRDQDGSTTRAFGVRVFPSTVLVGRDGRARLTVVGECDWMGAPARQWIEPLL
jgi:thiol-disulfide isomerase/thioredoxin